MLAYRKRRPPRSGRSYAARGGTPAAAQITRIGRRRLTRFGLTLAQTTKGLGRARRGPGQGSNVTQQANPLAGFGSEASEDQHYVLDASHTTKGMTAQ